jgi:putative transposase
VEGSIAERGVLTASDEAWTAAARAAEAIGPLAARSTVGLAEADDVAGRLGISRRQVYVLVGRWRAGEGVVSDLLPSCPGGGRGGGRLSAQVEAIIGEVLRTRYLSRQRRSVAVVCREIARSCQERGLAHRRVDRWRGVSRAWNRSPHAPPGWGRGLRGRCGRLEVRGRR